MGESRSSPAAILVRSADADPEKAEPDPIYGRALSATWKLLSERAENGAVDFGVEALRERLIDLDDVSPYLAPAAEAPVLLPAHLDLLCQTAPRPYTEPETALFLHGKDRGAPEVRVLWRSDLSSEDTTDWVETIALLPPVGGEMLSTPLYRLRAFLAESAEGGDDADIEGDPEPEEELPDRILPCVVWHGRDGSFVASNAAKLSPGDVVVLPASYGIAGLGQSAPAEALGDGKLDLWEPALARSGRPAAVRLNRRVLSPWLSCPPLEDLVSLAEEPELDRDSIGEAIDAVLAYEPAVEDAPAAPPSWWREKLREVRDERLEKHPGGGLVLARRGNRRSSSLGEPDLFADDDDLTSSSGEEQTLDEHSDLVKRTVEKLAARCLPDSYAEVLSRAAYWHDVGKLDERFQALLHHGDELAALAASAPLAKSSKFPVSPVRRQAIRAASGLPPNFRHEMLSAQLAGAQAPKFGDEAAQDLFLHLVASHHGHARPFAPVCEDPNPPAVTGRLGGAPIALSAGERSELPPPHRTDSGFAERFWRLVRRHGWWGLAYFEALVRLGDWYASGLELKEGSEEKL
jgi:CRISPR-associated endonuclease/helicase Cas3